MKQYAKDIIEIAKDSKCKKCIRTQSELRMIARTTEDNQLRQTVHGHMLDHDLHYSCGTKPCRTHTRKKEFFRPKA